MVIGRAAVARTSATNVREMAVHAARVSLRPFALAVCLVATLYLGACVAPVAEAKKKKDYYEILGVSKDATDRQIKKVCTAAVFERDCIRVFPPRRRVRC